MSNLIVPDSAPGRKSPPAQKGSPLRKNQSQILSGWIDDTEHTLTALQAWLDMLKGWQSQEKVSPGEFEAAYAILRRVSLEEWVKPGLDKLRAAVTGEKTVEQHDAHRVNSRNSSNSAAAE